MLETFGARLRRQREAQAVALDMIAERTKIKRSLLEALEHDDVSHWPSGIFRRSFMRAYAEAIHLDPEAAVRDFLSAYPNPAGAPEAPPKTTAADDRPVRPASAPETRRGFMAAIRSLGGRFRREPLAEEPSDAPGASVGDSAALAKVCTDLGRASTTNQVQACLRAAASLLDATGLIVWTWDEQTMALKPVIAHGYSKNVLAQLPPVGREANNATAAAFRSGEPQAIHMGDGSRGALVVPLMTAAGCAGVLAVEVLHGSEQTRPVRVAATIIAALLAQLARNKI